MTPVLSIVLSADLPNGEPGSKAEQWLFEAMSGAWLPLLDMLGRLRDEGVRAPLTLAISPGVMVSLADRGFLERFDRHLSDLVDAAEADAERLASDPLGPGARAWASARRRALEVFRGCDRDLLGAFALAARQGRLSLIPVMGTAPLPLLATDAFRRAHVQSASKAFEANFGHRPQGAWLPAGAWSPALGPLLRETGARYTIVSAEALRLGSVRPVLGAWAPVLTTSGLACFGAHTPADGTLSWGEEADSPYMRLACGDDPCAPWAIYGARRATRLGDARFLCTANEKASIYKPEEASEAAEHHAEAFVDALIERMGAAIEGSQRPPVALCAWPVGCFGVRWFEGWGFLEAVLKRAASSTDINVGVPEAILDAHPRCQVLEPEISSISAVGGGFSAWLSPSADWLYRHTRRLEGHMVDMALGGDQVPDHVGSAGGRGGGTSSDRLVMKAADLAVRELLLAQSAHWAELIVAGLHAEYGVERAQRHLGSARELLGQVAQGRADRGVVEAIESNVAGLAPAGLFEGLKGRLVTGPGR